MKKILILIVTTVIGAQSAMAMVQMESKIKSISRYKSDKIRIDKIKEIKEKEEQKSKNEKKGVKKI